MPSVKTQVQCPNCQFPVVADIQQLIDVGLEPGIKQVFLGGMLNIVQCPSCKQASMLSTPLVYHDPSKELLMSFFPPEMNLPMPEQEKIIGKLIQEAIDNLEPEQRKGYIFNPKQAFTLQGMLETILEADGITKEMLQEQQERVELLEKMLDMDDETLISMVKEDDEKFDQAFFSILSQMANTMSGGGQQDLLEKLANVQKKLLDETTYGKQLKQQADEFEAALEELKELGEDLTRDKMLELVINAETVSKVNAYVTLARQVMDYEFFAALSAKIDAAEGEDEEKLTHLRENLLTMTAEVDQQISARIEVAGRNLDALLEVDDIPTILQANLGAIDDFFLQVLSGRMAKAEEDKDADTLAKLQLIIDTLQKLSQPPAGAELLSELLQAPDNETRDKLMEEKGGQIDDKFLELVTNMMMQAQQEQGGDPVMAESLQYIYRKAVGKSMSASMKKE